MPRYVIQRDFPGAGKLSSDQLHNISQLSNSVIDKMGPHIQWEHSYVVDDKIYCVYIANNEELIREHAKRAEFPVTKIFQVGHVIDPTTGE